MAFRPLRGHEGKEKELPMTASTTLTKYNLCKMSSGYLVAAAGGDNEVEYVALQTKTSGGSNGEMCLVLPIDETITFEALSQDTPVQATHVGNDYDLQSAAQLDFDATTDKVFHVDKIVNATSKLVEGRFNKPAIA